MCTTIYCIIAFVSAEYKPSNWSANQKLVFKSYPNANGFSYRKYELVTDYQNMRIGFVMLVVLSGVIVAVKTTIDDEEPKSKIIITNYKGEEFAATLVCNDPKLVLLNNKVYPLKKNDEFEEWTYTDLFKSCP